MTNVKTDPLPSAFIREHSGQGANTWRLIEAIIAWLDLTHSAAVAVAHPSGSVAAPSPVERTKYVWVCSALGCHREIPSAGRCADHKPEQAPQAEATPAESELTPDDLRRIDAARDRVMSFARSHDPPDDVIRAAEGVTLEPGEYVPESRYAAEPPVEITEPVTARPCNWGSGWCWQFPNYLVRAVRRVAPESAAKPPADREP